MNRKWARSRQALGATLAATRAASRISSHLAGPFAARLWFTPWAIELSPRARAHQAAWLEGSTPVRFPSRSGRLSGFRAGSGPAVLLVHGWGERAGDMGAFIKPFQEAGFNVVGFDLPAHGESPGVQTNALITAAAVAEVAEQVGNVKAVIAHSMGAHAVMTAMSEGFSPDRVVLLAPAVRLEANFDPFVALFGLPPKAVAGLRQTIERRFGKWVWRDLAADRMAASFTTPALIVHDEDDPQIDVAEAERLEKAWSGARLIRTSGLGHGKLMRDPSVIARAVDFIRVDEPRFVPEFAKGRLTASRI